MNGRFQVSVLTAALLIALTMLPVMAAPPLAVHIEVESIIDPPGSPAEPFVATGPAVDAGVLCPTGDVVDLSAIVIDPPGAGYRLLRVSKQFTCANGTGTFDVNLVVRLDEITHETEATWHVAGGSGNYVALQGTGKLIGTPIEPGVSILDVYDGKIK